MASRPAGANQPSHSCGTEIEQRRAALLLEPGANPQKIEREYRNAKAKELANIKAGTEWDERIGISALREKTDTAWEASREIIAVIALTPPRTPTGAGALVVKERKIGEAE